MAEIKGNSIFYCLIIDCIVQIEQLPSVRCSPSFFINFIEHLNMGQRREISNWFLWPPAVLCRWPG
jgi:hypothetical protein